MAQRVLLPTSSRYVRNWLINVPCNMSPVQSTVTSVSIRVNIVIAATRVKGNTKRTSITW